MPRQSKYQVIGVVAWKSVKKGWSRIHKELDHRPVGTSGFTGCYQSIPSAHKTYQYLHADSLEELYEDKYNDRVAKFLELCPRCFPESTSSSSV